MKKIKMMIMLAMMSLTLCACEKGTTEPEDTAEAVTGQTTTEQTTTEQSTTEENGENREDATETNEQASQNDTNNKQESGNQGPDVAELVNARGDETTVYLLADGRYMDRTDAVYTYNGVDTWTDESGVEWNEVVK